MMQIQTGVFTNFANDYLKMSSITTHLEVAVLESIKKIKNETKVHCSGCSALDQILGAGGLKAGSTVEIYGENEKFTYDFAFNWAKKIQQDNNVIGVIDPFKELDTAFLKDSALHLGKSILIDIQDPFELTLAIMKLIKLNAVNLLIIPPGIMQQYWLDDRPTSDNDSASSMQDAFMRSLNSIVWLCRKKEVSLFLLNNNRRKRFKSPFVGNVRIKILDNETDAYRFARIEKNSYSITSINKQISIPK